MSEAMPENMEKSTNFLGVLILFLLFPGGEGVKYSPSTLGSGLDLDFLPLGEGVAHPSKDASRLLAVLFRAVAGGGVGTPLLVRHGGTDAARGASISACQMDSGRGIAAATESWTGHVCVPLPSPSPTAGSGRLGRLDRLRAVLLTAGLPPATGALSPGGVRLRS